MPFCPPKVSHKVIWNWIRASTVRPKTGDQYIDTQQVWRGLTEGRGQLKWDGTRAETRFRLSAKRTSPFKSVGASVQSTTGSRRVRISGSNAGYTMFRGSVKGTGYPLHSPVSPSLPLPCVAVCHHISTAVYYAGILLKELKKKHETAWLLISEKICVSGANRIRRNATVPRPLVQRKISYNLQSITKVNFLHFMRHADEITTKDWLPTV